MVAKLPLPRDSSVEIIDSIIIGREKHRDFFIFLKNDWLRAVNEYIKEKGDPNKIYPLDLSKYISQARIDVESNNEPRKGEKGLSSIKRLERRRAKSLIGLYKPDEESELYIILDKMRRKHGLAFCPSCGEPGKPGTLDHYLPKKEYPEYSVMLENLTPMCTECQGKKGVLTRDEFGNKLFIHPYFDPIEEVLLSLDISGPYENPDSFKVIVPDGVDNNLKSLVERHIMEIDFHNRFYDFCINEYTDLISLLSEERKEVKPDSASRIVSRFLKKAERQSPNRWEAIFYRGVLGNAGLLHYFDHAELPSYY